MASCDLFAGFDGFGRKAEKHAGRIVRKPQVAHRAVSGFPSDLPIAIAGGVGAVAIPLGPEGLEL
ncbi:hypothetical protein CSC3H3_21475 (plasmid) [Thalassospira marina]|uniref:Uncharacterized protein n=1 Tax=Thalassospira marina TaxID=2048283 RepID=A0ABM6QFV2_9PROT|nr:hypothetical protein CSC3H3_21475 [Thalassospira marina]